MTAGQRTMEVGYVALFDVLGFSSVVSSDQHGEGLQGYFTCLQEAFSSNPSDPIVDYVVFSDSIVLTTRSDSEDWFRILLLWCSRLFSVMLKKEIAVRGAIAHGSFVRKAAPYGVFVAGKAIIDAYNFEKAQDWIGIMLAPSAVKRVPDLSERCRIEGCQVGLDSPKEEVQRIRGRLSWAGLVQRCYNIPFHASSPFQNNDYDGFAVIPSDGDCKPRALHENLERSLKSLEWMKSLAPNPAAQSKYERAIRWLSNVSNRWVPVAESWDRFEREFSKGK
jgi:hypothetical protein